MLYSFTVLPYCCLSVCSVCLSAKVFAFNSISLASWHDSHCASYMPGISTDIYSNAAGNSCQCFSIMKQDNVYWSVHCFCIEDKQKMGRKWIFQLTTWLHFTQQSLHRAFCWWLQCYVCCRVTQQSWRKGIILSPSHHIQFPIHTTQYNQDILHWQSREERKKGKIHISLQQPRKLHILTKCFHLIDRNH